MNSRKKGKNLLIKMLNLKRKLKIQLKQQQEHIQQIQVSHAE